MRESTPKPICPKCGYDQSGEIATWESQCPVHGVCPECGLAFAWADVLDPARVDVPWYVEHARSRRSIFKRSLPTLWFLIIPNRFWKRVTLMGQIRIARLVVFLLILLATTHTISSVGMGASIYEEARAQNLRLTRYAKARPAQAAYFNQLKTAFDDPAYWSDLAVVSITHPYRGWLDDEYADTAEMFMIAASSSVALWVLILSVVPTTRRMAKMRFLHVVRALLLSPVGLIMLLALGRLSDAIEQLSQLSIYSPQLNDAFDRLSWIMPDVLWVFGAAYLVWIQWLWIAAIRIGWQIRPSWLLIMLGLIASILGGALGITLVWPI